MPSPSPSPTSHSHTLAARLRTLGRSALGLLPEVGLALAWATVISLIASWPLARRAWEVLPTPVAMPDLAASVWSAWHLADVLQHGGSFWSPTGLHWPIGQDNTLLLWNVGCQVLQLPLFATLPAFPAFNYSLIYFSVLNGLGGWAVGRAVGGGRAGGAAGAAVLVASPYAWGELIFGRMEQGLLVFLALAVAGLLLLLRSERRGWIVLTAVSWAAAGLCYWFYGYFMLLIVACVAGWQVVRRRWQRAIPLAWAGVGAALLAAPEAVRLLLTAMQDGSAYQQRAASTPFHGSADASSVTLASLTWPTGYSFNLHAILPLTLAVLLLLGLGPLRRRAGWLATLGVLALVFSMGSVVRLTEMEHLHLGGYEFVMPFAVLPKVLPGFWRFYWPERFLAVAVIAAAGCAGALTGALGRARWTVPVLLAALCTTELRIAGRICVRESIWSEPRQVQISSFYTELGREPGRHPLLFLPFAGPLSPIGFVPYHRQPVTAGNGDMEDDLQSPEWQAWIKAHPNLGMLQTYARSPQPFPERHPEYLDELGTLGLEWAVLPLESRQELLSVYVQLFDREPDHHDEQVAAWRLRPEEPTPEDATADPLR